MTREIAPDLLGITRRCDAAYPVGIVVEDHDLPRLEIKMTGELANVLYHELRAALVSAGERAR